MMFWLFRKACKKYKFTYALNIVSGSGIKLILRPYYTFENIDIDSEKYSIIFIKAIKAMKHYNNTHK